ncbi:isocitrate lyase/phosphoenolpyruvate mutase family protein [Pedobacter yulinensis]|uniref:Isocitrate lyase/phosphoenolpyruvate mutase family protein n=1 Tax=Pedobacter yulinensis TaxID=2126353 RepID=A0A2T3HIT5_9SPHI|nr:isocitrate lyase/phosphoenolpyruvate mutase family protein [Pedobacter yulinensis]PST82347.1 isocitrate lyase/phosphoenolpyruvate mutase family protein [Pedobacter yulinensis]
MNHKKIFSDLHDQSRPFVLGNFWDVHSARLLEQAGCKAIGTSSQAVATALGYDDGEQIPFEQLVRLAKSVTSAVSIPVTIDIEAGYSRNTGEILDNIARLQDNGVAGINIEDSLPGQARQLCRPADFAETLAAIADLNSEYNPGMFLNVRTDAFLTGHPSALSETLARAALYAESGADGLFVPGISRPSDIETLTGSTQLPVNVMALPTLPDFETLAKLGVKRISLGPFLFEQVYKQIGSTIKALETTQNSSQLFTPSI